jgi:hypothetical protein
MTSPTDALSLPLIAYRGLWDRFAAPLSADAVRRAYLRGVPSLIRCSDADDLNTAVSIVADPAVNRRRQPAYLVVDTLPWAAIPSLRVEAISEVFAIDGSEPLDHASPIYKWSDGAWLSAGSYVSVAAASRLESLAIELEQDSLVLFESTNIGVGRRADAHRSDLNDDVICEGLRKVASPSATLLRVSDFVELDWLRRQLQEAA